MYPAISMRMVNAVSPIHRVARLVAVRPAAVAAAIRPAAVGVRRLDEIAGADRQNEAEGNHPITHNEGSPY